MKYINLLAQLFPFFLMAQSSSTFSVVYPDKERNIVTSPKQFKSLKTFQDLFSSDPGIFYLQNNFYQREEIENNSNRNKMNYFGVIKTIYDSNIAFSVYEKEAIYTSSSENRFFPNKEFYDSANKQRTQYVTRWEHVKFEDLCFFSKRADTLNGFYKVLNTSKHKEYDYFIGFFLKGSPFLFFKDNFFVYYKSNKIIKQQYFICTHNYFYNPFFYGTSIHNSNIIEEYSPINSKKYKRKVYGFPSCELIVENAIILDKENQSVLDGYQVCYSSLVISRHWFSGSSLLKYDTAFNYDSIRITSYSKGVMMNNIYIRKYPFYYSSSELNFSQVDYVEYKNLDSGSIITINKIDSRNHNLLLHREFLIKKNCISFEQEYDKMLASSPVYYEIHFFQPTGIWYQRSFFDDDRLSFESLDKWENGEAVVRYRRSFDVYNNPNPDSVELFFSHFDRDRKIDVDGRVLYKSKKIVWVRSSETMVEQSPITYKYQDWSYNNKYYNKKIDRLLKK